MNSFISSSNRIPAQHRHAGECRDDDGASFGGSPAAPVGIGRYFRVMAAVSVLTFATVWLWVLAMPLAFLEPEYASWHAKQLLLERCDLGDVLILGDSRASVGIIPARLPVRATNLAVGGGEAIEALSVLTRALSCPETPRLVVISLDAVHFSRADLFWERTMRFGFLNAAELAELRDVSRGLGDFSVYEERHTDGIPSWLRDRLYLAHFPPFYFASLIEGRLLWRWWHNEAGLAASIAARGQYYFGVDEGSSVVAADGKLEAFTPLPVLDWYFNQIVSRLAERDIPAVFVAMPVNETTARAIRPEVQRAFAGFLAAYEARFPGFRVAGPVVRPWDDKWFGDGFSHLNPAGAERFSASNELNAAITEALGGLWRSDRLIAAGLTADGRRWSAATGGRDQPGDDVGGGRVLNLTNVHRLHAAPPSTQNDAQ